MNIETTKNGIKYIEDQNKIGIKFENGIIKYKKGTFKGINYILLISENSHLFVRTKKTSALPSAGFVKAVKSKEFSCFYSCLDNYGFSIS